MNPQIMSMRIALSEAQQEFEKLDSLCSGFVILILQVINPYESDVTQLKVEEGFAAMAELKANVTKMRELKTKIDKLEKELGGK
jgi:hypothetical protein